MTSLDYKYVGRVFECLQVYGKWLELGVGYGGETCKSLCEQYKLIYAGSDLFPAPNVDVIADFETPKDLFNSTYQGFIPYDGVLVLNVLEHTFDPILVLDNVISLLKPGGFCVIVTPVVWPIHNYPIDCWRPLPDFYRKYCIQRSLKLDESLFEYVGYGSIYKYRNAECDSYPAASSSKTKQLFSRIIHKLFNTTGRGMIAATHVAIGAVIKKPN